MGKLFHRFSSSIFMDYKKNKALVSVWDEHEQLGD